MISEHPRPHAHPHAPTPGRVSLATAIQVVPTLRRGEATDGA